MGNPVGRVSGPAMAKEAARDGRPYQELVDSGTISPQKSSSTV